MAYIRKRSELRTGYQEAAEWKSELDLQCDFIIAYGLDDTLKARIDKFREKGYEVHLMTGCAWGTYEDYLTGKWDGREHWDECQTDRNGEKIMHGVNIPYMVPTMSFVKYLTEKLYGLVDYGIRAIFMEEPEFWDAGGYSLAFQREYEAYYKEKWEAPHSSVTARYRCAKLKAWLYARLIQYLSEHIKKYSKETYGRETEFYVATHSQVNYTQWKILNPGSKMVDMDGVDGFIAQVWSGTSGTGNVYNGVYKSRTFETAYLEYGSMQELIYGTERKMWFLHDPVEDYPENGWDVYRKKYIKTVIASLFWPRVDRYEVCPWPNRVFNGRYPRKLGMADGMIPTTDMEGARDIPEEYATMLSAMIQTLGNMQQEEYIFLGNEVPVGVLISDSSTCQRNFPDMVYTAGISGETQEISMKDAETAMNDRILSLEKTSQEAEFYSALYQTENGESDVYAYQASCAYPSFFGLTMPLLKHGLPIRPIYLEHTVRYEEYLSAYQYLILSYEYMKPDLPEYNEALAEWVRRGGCLIYVGNESDPYHGIHSWWNQDDKIAAAMSPTEMSAGTPTGHLFSLLGLDLKPTDGTYLVGEGRVAVFWETPLVMTLEDVRAKRYRQFVKSVLFDNGYVWKETNCLAMQRGPYLIAAAMDENSSQEDYQAEGHYADLLADGFPYSTKICVCAGNEGLFFDYDKIAQETFCIIATAARIEKMECTEDRFILWEKAADRIHVHTRVRLPWKPDRVSAVDENGSSVTVECVWEEESQTALLTYNSKNKLVKIDGQK